MTDFLTNDPRFYAARKTDQSGGRGWDLRPDIGAASDRAETRGAFIRGAVILFFGCVSVGAIWTALPQ